MAPCSQTRNLVHCEKETRKLWKILGVLFYFTCKLFSLMAQFLSTVDSIGIELTFKNPNRKKKKWEFKSGEHAGQES
jgi:hypothetical protein